MAQEVRKIIGDTTSFALDLRWPTKVPDEVRELAWADLYLWVDGLVVWNARWTWLDLVEWLARAWPFIFYEENYPFGLVVDAPEKLTQKGVMGRVKDLSPIEVEDEIFAYQHRHDMAAGLKGIYLPSVWILPEGSLVRISARRPTGKRMESIDRWLDASWLDSALNDFADFVFEHTGEDTTGRASLARERWENRRPSPETILRLRSGLTLDQLEEWLPHIDPQRLLRDPVHGTDSEFTAAARLTTSLTETTRRQVIQAIGQVGKCTTDELDELANQARQVLSAVTNQRPYQQGQRVARWLRTRLKIPEDPIDPARLLTEWGVLLQDLPPLEHSLDAVACWGSHHGPAVLINPQGKHSRSATGRNATLAHEIAHLLLDRGYRLPAAEVFGGTTPLDLEQRARAFAAELLIPQTRAARALAEADDFTVASDRLREDYGVSNELLGWQIWNGPAKELLSPAERTIVQGWCRQFRKS